LHSKKRKGKEGGEEGRGRKRRRREEEDLSVPAVPLHHSLESQSDLFR